MVADYFGKEKITEESLRVLKTNVAKAVDDYRKDNKTGTYPYIQRRASSPSHPSRTNQPAMTRIRKARRPRNGPNPNTKK